MDPATPSHLPAFLPLAQAPSYPAPSFLALHATRRRPQDDDKSEEIGTEEVPVSDISGMIGGGGMGLSLSVVAYYLYPPRAANDKTPP